MILFKVKVGVNRCYKLYNIKYVIVLRIYKTVPYLSVNAYLAIIRAALKLLNVNFSRENVQLSQFM